MLARILRIKGCVASALLNFEKTDIEFTSKDFELMRKVTMIIRFFHEATQMLSEDDCSVSMSIPIVATIQKALQVHSSDTGVKTLKRGLHESMTQRFGDMETIPEYSVATFLDPRYKHFYFQNTSTLEEVTEIIVTEVSSKLGGPPISKSDSVSSQSSEDSFSTEGSFGAAMRKFVEKQQKPKHPKNSSQSREDQINIFFGGWGYRL